MKFLCLVYEEERRLNELSREEWQALREETLNYVETLRANGHLVDTRPLKSARTASTLRIRDGRLAVTDGPFAETKEQIGGYFLIEASSREEAIRLASQWPSAKIGTIEVRPIDEGLSLERRYG